MKKKDRKIIGGGGGCFIFASSHIMNSFWDGKFIQMSTWSETNNLVNNHKIP